MKLYEVGRSSIREAIKKLAMVGVLTVQQGSGTFVCDHQQDETIDQKLRRAGFDEINAVRRLLENEIVRLASLNYTAPDIAEMKRCLEDRKQAINADQLKACIDADIAFHIAIAHASANSVMDDLYKSFTSIIRESFSKREVKGIARFAMSHHLHEQLFEAIRAKKEKQAQQVLNTILENNY
ncbi:FadR/GntR family transcriptional regulator [Mucilaginibacter sp. SP1R1]|uniref:FadR/GntR family transcriptional regulator n=1 Tax=Mucilaginibacter sp. SP1R1 TaxID=2723091 RepID=UPI003AFFFF0E